ncbi:MAG TPA: LysM peptidoglycan-binding domain-containing protein [Acidimicrobiia bacterium]|nr:LysM peptidoglycan-binding domain-containing protein [Acidimicrobiia bacterium]
MGDRRRPPDDPDRARRGRGSDPRVHHRVRDGWRRWRGLREQSNRGDAWSRRRPRCRPRPPSSLFSIAGLYGLTTQDLATCNNISNINHFVGEVIKAPPATTPTTVPAPTKKR